MCYGKTDFDKIHLGLWDDDNDCTEFSLTGAILVWVALSGIKGGKLSPCKKHLSEKTANQHRHCLFNAQFIEVKKVVQVGAEKRHKKSINAVALKTQSVKGRGSQHCPHQIVHTVHADKQ